MSSVDILNGNERSAADFWMVSPYGECPLVHVNVAAVAKSFGPFIPPFFPLPFYRIAAYSGNAEHVTHPKVNVRRNQNFEKKYEINDLFKMSFPEPKTPALPLTHPPQSPWHRNHRFATGFRISDSVHVAGTVLFCSNSVM